MRVVKSPSIALNAGFPVPALASVPDKSSPAGATEGVRSGIAAVALLAVLPLLFFWRLTLAGEVLFWGMPLLQFFPWRSFAVQEYLQGQLPLWNPYAGLGAPL